MHLLTMISVRGDCTFEVTLYRVKCGSIVQTKEAMEGLPKTPGPTMEIKRSSSDSVSYNTWMCDISTKDHGVVFGQMGESRVLDLGVDASQFDVDSTIGGTHKRASQLWRPSDSLQCQIIGVLTQRVRGSRRRLQPLNVLSYIQLRICHQDRRNGGRTTH
jgi:hypothetical protein